MPTISVAVITFNGEKYVREQLESIKAQSLTPQQVLIFDDCSSDKTVEIISEFIKTNNLSHWKLFKQISNVGWRQNIFEVLMQCDTDIIFWSDQDDVWDNNKIEILTSLITDTDDNCMAAYSSWRYIDSFGNLLENFSGKNKNELILIDKYSPKMNIPPLLGCSACFRKELLAKLSEIIPCEFNSSDWILYFLAIGLGKVAYFDKPLFKRRIHDNNVTASLSGMRRNWKFDYENCKMSLTVLNLQLKTLEKIINVLGTTNLSNSFIENEYQYLKYRIDFVEKRENIGRYLYFSFKQNQFEDLIYTLLKDIFFIFSSRKSKFD